MLIDIDKIVVRDRIRKDFGDIAELADDIKKNGLINPPAISRSNELIAGERRLRACKSLGWKQIEVHQIDVDDAEKQLYMEISENETRKDFSMTERLDYARRLARVESAKHKQGQRNDLTSDTNMSEVQRVSEVAAKESGIGSREKLRKASFIADNRDMVSPEDFANWDDGKLSTNKLYNQIKKQKHDLAVENQTLKDAHQQLVQKNARLQMELDERKPEVKVVEKVPDDYEGLKRKARQMDAYRRDFEKERIRSGQKQQKINELEEKVKQVQEQTAREQSGNDLKANALYFGLNCKHFIEDNAGYLYIASEITDLPEKERKQFLEIVKAMYAWSQNLMNQIERSLNKNGETITGQ